MSRDADVGTTLYGTNSALTNDVIQWPRATPTYQGAMLSFYGYIIGVNEDWTDASGAQHTRRIAQIQDGNFSDIEEVTVPVEGAFKRVYRTPYPTLTLDGTDRTAVQAQGDPTRTGLASDVMLYNHHTTWTGLDMERWVYGFTNEPHDDYVFHEFRFTNRSDETKNGVYIALPAQPATPATQPRDLWADYYGADYRQYVAGDASADSMRLFYAWDGDGKEVQDTKGNPNATWGNFQKPQYYGMAILHADRSADDPSDDPSQPWKAGWVPWDFDINMNEDTHEATYDKLSQGWPQSLPGGNYAQSVNGQGEVVQTGAYREIKPGINITQYDTGEELSKIGYMIFGPYTVDPGEDLHFVTAFAGGTIDPRLAIDAGRAYANGYANQVDLKPLPYDVRDTNGDLIAAEGETLSKAQKDRILDMGQSLLFQEAAKARRIWEESDVQFGGQGFASETSGTEGSGRFDILKSPASPSLTGTSENDQVRLEWGDEAAQFPGAGGAIEEYRIYRNYKRPASAVGPTDTTLVLHDTVSPDTREYVDTDVIRGEDYYYSVTAVNQGGVESSIYLNRTNFAGPPEISALTPTRPPAENWQENVVVVPNPYHVQAAQKYGGRRLNFLNLPAYANVRIYTMTGDLVQTLEHNSDTGDEDWQRQDTFSTMEIVSGVYFYVVEELDSPNGSPTGNVARGKFVVIK